MPRSSSSRSASSLDTSSADHCDGRFHARDLNYDCWKCAKCGTWYCWARQPGATAHAGPRYRYLDRRYGRSNCYGRAGRTTKSGRVRHAKGCGTQVFLSVAAPNPAQPDQEEGEHSD